MQFSSLVRSFSKSGDFSWSLLTNNNGAVQDTKSKPQVVEIQGLRGVAIIGVLLFHLWGKTTFKEGYLGVDIFFVISGYLMCLLLTRETQLTVGRVTDFYYRRAKRIVPIYLLVIWLVLIAAVFHFIYPIDYLPFISESLKPLLFIANVPDSTADDYFIQSMGAYRFLKHCWSLSVEIQFYFFVPALIWLLNLFAPNTRIAVISFLGFASFWKQVHSTANDEHMSMVGRIWQFMFAYYIQRTENNEQTTENTPRIFKLPARFQNYNFHSIGSKIFHAAVTYILIASLWFKFTPKKHLNRLILLAATTLIISRPRGNWLLGQWWLVWLGDASYSIYLVHYPLFEWHRYEFISMYQFNEQTTFIAGIVLIVVSIVLGYVIERSYHWLSRWISSWSRLLLVIIAGYLFIGVTSFYLIKTSVPQSFQLDRNQVLENAEQLAAETIDFWENRELRQPMTNKTEIIEWNNKLQYLTWNLVTCKQPQKELLPTQVNINNSRILWSCTEALLLRYRVCVSWIVQEYGDVRNQLSTKYKFLKASDFTFLLTTIIIFTFYMLEAERDFEGGYKNSYNRCTKFRSNAFKMLRKWNYKIDVIIVAVNYHRFVSYPLAANLTEDAALQEMNSIYEEFSSLAREVVFMPQIHFITGIDPHSATLQRQILYDRNLDAFQTTIKNQIKFLTSGRNRLEMVECSKCILVDWLKIWCDEQTQKCDSIDLHHRLSYFFDSHHVNALGSLKVGVHLRQLYDQWRNKQEHVDYGVNS